MQLDGFRDTRLGGRYGGQGDSSGRLSGVSGADSARSNIPRVTAWEVEIPRDHNGQDEATPQRVQVVADEQGRSLVVDDKGRATGEVVVIDPQDGRTSVIRDQGVVGRFFDIEENREESSPTTTSTISAPDVRGDRSVRGESSPTEAVVSRGGDSPIDGMLGGVGAAVGAAVVVGRRVRRRDDSHRVDIDWGGGRRQSLVLLEGPESAREHVFDMDVPPGGRMVKNPDGSVDVVDARGEVVEHVDAPWAFDAAGRRVPTWYEVGEGNQLVQVVDPERTTLLPVLADPDRRKSGTGGYKAGKAAGKPERKKIKGVGAPPPSLAGEKDLLGKYPKQDPQNVCTPSPQSQQGKDLIKKYPAGSKPLPPDYSGVGKPLPPDAPRRKIKAVGGPQPNPYEPLPEKKGAKGSGKSDAGKSLKSDVPRRKIKRIGAPPESQRGSVGSGKNTTSKNSQAKKKSDGSSWKQRGRNAARKAKNTLRSGAKKINEWNDRQLEKYDKGIQKREKSDNRVTRSIAKAERWFHRGEKALSESVSEGISDSAPLVGMGEDGAPGVKESWREGLGSLVSASDDVSAGEAWKHLGKEAIAYEEWKEGDYPEAIAVTVVNVVRMKGVDKLSKLNKVSGSKKPEVPSVDQPNPQKMNPDSGVRGNNPAPKKGAGRQAVESAAGVAPQVVAATAPQDPADPPWFRAEGQNEDTVPPALQNTDFFPEDYRPYGDLAREEFREKWGTDKNPKWPEHDGFSLDENGDPVFTVADDIPEGTELDRIGHPTGKFLGNRGILFRCVPCIQTRP